MQSGFEDWSTARSLRADDATPRQIARMWERTEWVNGCRLWAGYTNAGGYGVMAIGHKPFRSILVHRLALALKVDELPARAYALHSCDVRTCTNQDRLSVGTHEQNQQQKLDRGRQAVLAGESNPRARLNAEVVAQMRSEYFLLAKGEKKAYRFAISQRYGITDSAVRAALYGESWYLTAGREAVLKGIGV